MSARRNLSRYAVGLTPERITLALVTWDGTTVLEQRLLIGGRRLHLHAARAARRLGDHRPVSHDRGTPIGRFVSIGEDYLEFTVIPEALRYLEAIQRQPRPRADIFHVTTAEETTP